MTAVLGLLFLLPAALAALGCRALSRRSEDEWQLLAWIPVLPLTLWGAHMAWHVGRDPSSHNLWPFELVAWSVLTGILFGALVLLRRVASRGEPTGLDARRRKRLGG